MMYDAMSICVTSVLSGERVQYCVRIVIFDICYKMDKYVCVCVYI